MDNSFNKLSLNEELIKGLEKLNITTPMKIQEEVIPVALQNKDIIAKSETGTGKTLAYLLPIFQKIDVSKREMQVLIIVPTHELSMQVYNEINKLSEASEFPITAASIIGEVNITRQIDKLKEKPRLIVGTPGRVLELIKKKKITAHTLKTIVVDEADRLLDFNNIDNLKAIIKTTLRERQLMLFSATMPDKVINIAKDLMKEPQIIIAKQSSHVNSNITHYYFLCEQRDKIELLRKLVHSLKPKRAMVFINKTDEIEITASKLKYHKLIAEALHGKNIKEDRKRTMEAFRNGKLQLLVASDLAARGLDIQGVSVVFNLDIPEKPKDYLHRAGRTGRAGEEGLAISLVTERELTLIKSYEKSFNIIIHPKDLYMGKIIERKLVRTTQR